MKLLLVPLLLVGCATAPLRASRPPLKPLEHVLAQAGVASCTAGLHPIPATVIDVGTLKHVPYQSFSNGTVELNAYGDPEHLAALEIGTDRPMEHSACAWRASWPNSSHILRTNRQLGREASKSVRSRPNAC